MARNHHVIQELTIPEFHLLIAQKTLENAIGQGNFSTVYVVEFNYKPYAMKCFQSTNFKSWKAEKDNLTLLRHDNIIRLEAYFCDEEEENDNILLYELLNSNLKNSLEEIYSKGKWMECINIFIQIAKGIECLVSHEMVTGDLKPENIMFDKKDVIKLIDLGGAKKVPKPIIVSTAAYCPPEFRNVKTHKKSDIYSFGIIILQMIMRCADEDLGKAPKKYADLTNKCKEHITSDLAKKIERKGHVVDLNWFDQGCTLKAAQKISRLGLECTKFVENQRPSIENIIVQLEDVLNLTSS